jgi:transposase
MRFFSEEQTKELEHEFLTNKYLSTQEISDLAEKFDVEESQVKLWFKNRRTKSNKINIEAPKKVNKKSPKKVIQKSPKKVSRDNYDGLENSDVEDFESKEVSVEIKRLSYRDILKHTKSQKNPFREVQNRKGIPSADIKPNVCGISIGTQTLDVKVK